MQTIGEILRSEREKKGLTVKEIEIGTSIRTLYITAIEEGNYSIIPGEVYLKGFIRNYADFLELDSQRILDLYRQSQNTEATEAEGEIRKPLQENHVPEMKLFRSGTWLIAGGLLLCLAGGVWWYQNTANSLPETKTDTKIQQSAPAIPSQTITEESSVPSQVKPVVVIAKYSDQCWTMVTADNKIIYEGTPKVGETLTWEGEQKVTVKAGNAGGIDIVYNGQTMGKLGKKGDVVVKTFAAQK